MAIPIDVLPANAAGTLAAVACVIAGGPLFADGLRALRARRALATLLRAPADSLAAGPVSVRGRVALDSPLFAPLSSVPCAGFVLELRLPDGSLAGRVREARGFRLEGSAGAVVVGGETTWELGVTAERTFASFADLSENLAALIRRSPELNWLGARAGALRVVERALPAGRDAFVLGTAERLFVAVPEPVLLQRTGTDDADVVSSDGRPDAPAWRIGADGPLERCVVSDRALEPRHHAPPAWRLLGTIIGPALTLVGLVELARASGPLLGRGL